MAQHLLFKDSLVNKTIILVISTIFIIGLIIILLAANYFNIPTIAYPFLSLSLVIPLILMLLLYKIDITANEHNVTVTLGIGLIKSIIPYTAIEKNTIETIDVFEQSTGVKREGNKITYSMNNVFLASKFSTKSNNHYTIATSKAAELTKILQEQVK